MSSMGSGSLKPLEGRSSGLTLVELLLTVTLFATLLAAVGGFLNTSMRVQDTWGRNLVPAQQIERTLNQMERDLETAQPFFAIPVSGGSDGMVLARVERLADMDGQVHPDWVKVAYQLQQTEHGMLLIRNLFRWRDDTDPPQPIRHENFLSLQEGHWMFGVLDAQQHFMWAASWDGKKYGVPRLVKFEFTAPAMGGSSGVSFSRVFRNPAGNLPTVEGP